MDFAYIWARSLKTRVSVVALVVFLLTLWALTWYAGDAQRSDMQALLGEEQRSTVGLVASHVEEEITDRIRALQLIAGEIGPGQMGSPRELQRVLESKPVFVDHFSGGAFITGTDGVVRAAIPASLPRIGRSYADRDYFKAAVREGRLTVGLPILGRVMRVPVIVLATPLHDRHGKIIGMLAAGVDLSKPSFMDRISEQPFATAGSYFIVSKARRQIVVSSNKERSLAMLPPPGVNPTVDRFVNGFEGVTVFVNSEGTEVLAAVKGIPAANWFAAVSIPTAVAFAPIHRIQQQIAGVAVVLTLVAGASMWLLLRRELAPLQRMARELEFIRDPDQMPQLAPGRYPDEVGQVITGFNRLSSALALRRRSLLESEERYRAAWQASPDALALSRLADGLYLDVNDRFAQLTGWSREEMIGYTSLELGVWARPEDRQRFGRTVAATGGVDAEEYELRTRSGRAVRVQVSARRVTVHGEFCALKVIHDLTARDAAREQIEQLEHSDMLTGLPNRRSFIERTSQAIAGAVRHGRLGAVVYIDLDEFQTLNDTLGHDQGDRLLETVAARLRQCVRVEDTVARIGGDEFAVLLEGLDADPARAAAQAETVASSIHLALSPPVAVGGADYRLRCSIGVTLMGQALEPSLEPLRRADLAMHQAKAAGRDRTFFFEPHMQTFLNARAAMQSDLHRAIEQGRLQLHYQVQVDRDGVVRGVEALVRWPDPHRGMVAPSEFIPLAEGTGLIVPLGQWVLETACARLAAWSGDPALAGITIAVNVSARQVQQDSFVEEVLRALSRTGAPPGRLKLEITESLLAHDMDGTIAKMNALKARGIGFSIDDFGTGFSSLLYLKRLPLDQLKIDQSFVRDILVDANDLAIAKMIVALGNTLGLDVIAEGVETAGQRDALLDLGCFSFQGYLFGRPVAAQEVEHLLRRPARTGSHQDA